jgi:hypothetical protein
MATFQMTARRFANLSRSRAQEHLTKHRSYLESHPFIRPLLASKEAPELVFDRCKNALFTHWRNAQNEALAAEYEAKKNAPKSPSSRYIVRIFGDVNGKIEVLTAKHTRMTEDGKTEAVMKPMEYPAADYASAERLADRRLFSREDSIRAEISNTDGKVITTCIERRDAIARVLAKPKHAVVKGPKRSADLRWKPKSRATRNITKWSIMR